MPSSLPANKFARRSTIELTAVEKESLRQSGTALIRRPVEWPLPGRVADFARASVDPGGTDIWGPGPYLKVPNRSSDDGEEVVNRDFCPWGYPPDTLRIAWSSRYVTIVEVKLTHVDTVEWEWLLTIQHLRD